MEKYPMRIVNLNKNVRTYALVNDGYAKSLCDKILGDFSQNALLLIYHIRDNCAIIHVIATDGISFAEALKKAEKEIKKDDLHVNEKELQKRLRDPNIRVKDLLLQFIRNSK